MGKFHNIVKNNIIRSINIFYLSPLWYIEPLNIYRVSYFLFHFFQLIFPVKRGYTFSIKDIVSLCTRVEYSWITNIYAIYPPNIPMILDILQIISNLSSFCNHLCIKETLRRLILLSDTLSYRF